MDRFVYLDAFADAGETQAMLLYKEVAIDYLLIDDRCGRKVAQIKMLIKMSHALQEQCNERYKSAF